MTTRTIVQALASMIQARKNCEQSGNHEWFAIWSDRLDEVQRDLPSGSGVDCGTKVDLDASSPDKVVLTCSFHHMDENGSYDGWTDHKIVVRPTFESIKVDVKGRDRNQIKDYLADLYYEALRQPYAPTGPGTIAPRV